jgi:hypothetical protein
LEHRANLGCEEMEKGEAMGVEVATDTTRKKVEMIIFLYYAESILWLANHLKQP